MNIVAGRYRTGRHRVSVCLALLREGAARPMDVKVCAGRDLSAVGWPVLGYTWRRWNGLRSGQSGVRDGIDLRGEAVFWLRCHSCLAVRHGHLVAGHSLRPRLDTSESSHRLEPINFGFVATGGRSGDAI